MATIHQLPSAAAVPPVQIRGRGRFPKHIVPLHLGRDIRQRRIKAEKQREDYLMQIALLEFRARDLRSALTQITKG